VLAAIGHVWDGYAVWRIAADILATAGRDRRRKPFESRAVPHATLSGHVPRPTGIGR
jgi:hypothetical protein